MWITAQSPIDGSTHSCALGLSDKEHLPDSAERGQMRCDLLHTIKDDTNIHVSLDQNLSNPKVHCGRAGD